MRIDVPNAFVLLALAAPVVASATWARAAADHEFGKYLSAECVTCHQLTGRNEGIAPIIGWRDPKFIDAMNEYRSKKRANLIMQTLAGRLSDEEIAALAAYFGGLKPQPGTQ